MNNFVNKWLRTLGVLSVLGGGAALMAAARADCTDLPPLPAVPADARRVTDFGAVADDDRPDDAALARALAALRPGDWLVFPPGRYVLARSLLVTTPDVTLWGPGATLHGTDPADHTLGLRADGVRVFGLTLTAVTDRRRSEPAQARISLYGGHAGNVVRGVRIDGAGSGGMLVHGAVDFTIADNIVTHTRADGIHVTGASRHGRVVGNRVTATGDDMIAIVSYDDAAPVRDVLVAGNVVDGTRWGRGLSVVGGAQVTLRGNTVSDIARAAGILIAQEGNWHTHGVDDVRIEDNRLRGIQRPAARAGLAAPPTGHAAIEIHTFLAMPWAEGIGAVMLRGNAVEDSGVDPLRQRAGRRVDDTPGARLDCARLDARLR